MSNNDPAGQDAQNQQQNLPQNPTGQGGQTPIDSLPPDIQAYIKSLRDEAKNYRTQVDDYLTKLRAAEDAQNAQLAEQGNYKALAEKHAAEAARLKAIAERAESLEAIIRESNAARVKELPETVRGLVPMDYAPEKLQSWLNANEGLLKRPPAANYDAGAGAGGSGGGGVKVTDEDRRAAEVAKAAGYTLKPEDIAKRRETMAKTTDEV